MCTRRIKTINVNCSSEEWFKIIRCAPEELFNKTLDVQQKNSVLKKKLLDAHEKNSYSGIKIIIARDPEETKCKTVQCICCPIDMSRKYNVLKELLQRELITSTHILMSLMYSTHCLLLGPSLWFLIICERHH